MNDEASMLRNPGIYLVEHLDGKTLIHFLGSAEQSKCLAELKRKVALFRAEGKLTPEMTRTHWPQLVKILLQRLRTLFGPEKLCDIKAELRYIRQLSDMFHSGWEETMAEDFLTVLDGALNQ